MHTMREAWTDERLDDLSERMDRGFDRVDKDLRELRADVKSLQGKVDERFEATHRLMVQVAVGMSAAMVTGFVGLATLIVATS
jgi:hypothetical protein